MMATDATVFPTREAALAAIPTERKQDTYHTLELTETAGLPLGRVDAETILSLPGASLADFHTALRECEVGERTGSADVWHRYVSRDPEGPVDRAMAICRRLRMAFPHHQPVFAIKPCPSTEPTVRASASGLRMRRQHRPVRRPTRSCWTSAG